jgi:hypothetical protein
MKSKNSPEYKAWWNSLSPSSRFNILFMRRTNLLAILIFVVGILAKVIYEFGFKR